MPAIACPAPEMEATELEAPRTAVGLNTLYMAMASEETGTVTCERGRWLCDPESDATRIVQLTAKNQYETPNYVWRRMVALEGVNFDACATPLSAVRTRAGGRHGGWRCRGRPAELGNGGRWLFSLDTIVCTPPSTLRHHHRP